jgi:hypothetical protein
MLALPDQFFDNVLYLFQPVAPRADYPRYEPQITVAGETCDFLLGADHAQSLIEYLLCVDYEHAIADYVSPERFAQYRADVAGGTRLHTVGRHTKTIQAPLRQDILLRTTELNFYTVSEGTALAMLKRAEAGGLPLLADMWTVWHNVPLQLSGGFSLIQVRDVEDILPPIEWEDETRAETILEDVRKRSEQRPHSFKEYLCS